MIPGIDVSVLLILGIIFSSLSVTERLLYTLNKRGLLHGLYNKIHKKRELVERSIKEASLKNKPTGSIMSSEMEELVDDIRSEICDHIPEIINELGLVSIS
jgi:hypothetical protein